MDISLHSSLKMHFGYADFRPGQAEAIQSLLDGKHTLVVMPTGSGKSLVFQLAALHLPGVTLVISPLIALMKDQVDGLERRGIPATFINSTLNWVEQNRRLKDFAAGKYRLVYIAPERLRSVHFMEAMRQQTCSLLAVDEAHCISEWGHDFRPDYLRIAQFRASLGYPLTVALTATATPQVQDDIARLLNLPTIQRVVTGFNRPNLALEVRNIPDMTTRLKALQELLVDQGEGAAIVYTGTRRDAEEVAEFIREVVGIPAEHYHAGLPIDKRTWIQDAFMSGRLSMVAATNAFGMGIDRADVRQLIHYALPGSLEAYYQEAGRAGRDGLQARAVLLYSPEDRALQEWFIESSAITCEDLALLYDALKSISSKQGSTTVETLSRITGQHEIKVRVGLAELEQAGMLDYLGDEGLRIRVGLRTWNAEEIRKIAARIKVHQQRRREQLSCMITYAESNECRRSIILKHFGDKGSPEAEICCDNCLARKPKVYTEAKPSAKLTQPERTALVVLDTVRWLKRKVGREKLVQILQGSKAKGILELGYNKLAYYGRLAFYSQRGIREIIDQLLELDYLKMIGGEYPVLHLTPLGEMAVKNNTPIPLKLPRQVSNLTIQRRSENLSAEIDQLLASGQLAQDNNGFLITTNIGCDNTAKPIKSIKAIIQEIVEMGESRSVCAVPELIGYLQNKDGNIRRLAASALGKIGDPQATVPLIQLLEEEEKPQVRQYAVKALGELGDNRAINILETIECDSNEKEYTRIAARNSLKKLRAAKSTGGLSGGANQYQTQNEDAITAFLSRSHPRQLPGPWDSGWTLGFHSGFQGAVWSRSRLGELVFRLKYQGDLSVLPELVKHAVEMIEEHAELIQVDAVVSVPPSTQRANDPVRCFAQAMVERFRLHYLPALVKARQTMPQKEMRTLAQKRANVAGAFKLQEPVRNKRLLVVDDLYDSGATLEEIVRLLRSAGVSRVNVLTLTRTIHADR